ncbi:DUF6542 domain-containing protein [Streptomyces sp. NPDC101152]|uniref:DUF6542 domain-containing protein n=1 Tax=Streptomyces sp. NPDC101152 TaxID=3366116 RepID=UPI0037FABF21
MEQHRTRPPHDGTRRGTPPLPPQAARGGAPGNGNRPAQKRPAARPAAVRRQGPPPAATVRRLPNPRLTGLGGGLFCGAVMLVLGFLDELLFGSSTAAYGVLFLPVCVLTAIWVRKSDLVTAPVVVPIAFAVGLVPVANGAGGLSGRLMGLVTALATQVGWLYGGTLVAGSIVTVRKVALMRRQAVRRRTEPPR